MATSITTDYADEICRIVTDMTSDWDDEFSGDITPDSALIQQLGFESLDVVHLVTAIEQHYDRRDLPWDQLLMNDGQYVPELTIAQFADFLQRQR